MGTALERSESETLLTRKAASYDLPASRVDGMDVLAVERAAAVAVDAVRSGAGPQFLELATYRFRAHSMFDPELYRSKSEVEEWKKRDPIATLTTALHASGLLTDGDVGELENAIADELAAAVEFAEHGTLEPLEELETDVYTRAVK
jgi:TPP-dependent pyruvate/acetoin dehydrogenase alpha subunit